MRIKKVKEEQTLLYPFGGMPKVCDSIKKQKVYESLKIAFWFDKHVHTSPTSRSLDWKTGSKGDKEGEDMDVRI